jgi:putative oxidoreductase
MLATIFLVSGFGKLTTPAATLDYIASAGFPLPQLARTVAILIELGAGALLLLGYRRKKRRRGPGRVLPCMQ